MNCLKLPLLSEIKERRLKTFWRAEGVPVSISSPDAFSELLFFTADESWQGVMNLGEWFSHVAPEMSGLSNQMYDNLQLKRLFSATERPVDLPPQSLSYKKLRLQALPDHSIFEKPLLCLETSQGALWITKLPEMEIPRPSLPKKLNLSILPIPLTFEIGVSQLSLGLLKKISVGDILLISQLTDRVSTAGIGIGCYQKNEGKIMIEKRDEEYDKNLEEDEYEDEYEDEEQNEHEDEEHQKDQENDDGDDAGNENKVHEHHPEDQKKSSSLCAQVPVTLTFILQKNKVTVEKLEKMYEGEVIPLEPSIEERIEIRANNVRIARGKLLGMENGALGVELTQLYQSKT
ncbi:FliM/FliN family flagellar motor switch protein [Candidatus Williamhamiltonella defendens]|uniref:FliM/FliN family flagellar motor switch protein n=4 Tax=Candidatus Williamhamiltonella defendens TaxID=138072 RepID=UPI001584167C|nr:FliM/FliN family flagellar motor switch protein [Candidatus Hamiltonella defensa]